MDTSFYQIQNMIKFYSYPDELFPFIFQGNVWQIHFKNTILKSIDKVNMFK